MKIKILAQDGKARSGEFETTHGMIQTPCFMPIATAGALKGIEVSEARELGAEMILANTYHLALRPGVDVIKNAGGLHQFMGMKAQEMTNHYSLPTTNSPLPLLTDSGGFQVFSLAKIRKITEEGVEFASHIDGKALVLTPERSIEIQMALGADIIMAFDECKAPDSRKAVLQSVELTTRWAKRSREKFAPSSFARDEKGKLGVTGLSHPLQPKAYNLQPSLFGIVQGATDSDLRKKSAREIVKIGFDGYAIGGLSVGESAEEMYSMLDVTVPLLPEDQPRYLMGVGTPANIIEAVACGIDMFDCVLPTRNARHGYLFTSQGVVQLRNEKYHEDFSALDPDCDCNTCTKYHKAYLRHLLTSGEVLAIPLLVRHNVRYYLRLMEGIRAAIRDGRFEALRAKFKKGIPRLARCGARSE